MTPFLIPHLFVYHLCEKKAHIHLDLLRFAEDYWGLPKDINMNRLLIKVLLFCPEFRNIFYNRVSFISRKHHLAFILEALLPPYKFLSIGVPADKIGKGLFIQHGNSTIIHALEVGENCWINQNVTIGDNGRGIPTIGNNVRVGTGAVILGPIFIGNDVIIGANATVVKDVPNGCTVVPSPSYIIKRNGKIVYDKL